MSSGATTSAARAKKDWVRCLEGVVAMGVALYEVVLRSADSSGKVGSKEKVIIFLGNVRRATQGCRDRGNGGAGGC